MKDKGLAGLQERFPGKHAAFIRYEKVPLRCVNLVVTIIAVVRNRFGRRAFRA